MTVTGGACSFIDGITSCVDEMSIGNDDEWSRSDNTWAIRLTEYEYNDHEHGGEEHGLNVDLVEDLVPGQQGVLSAVEHDAKAAENHAKRENRDSPLLGGYASWRSRADAVSDLVGRQRDEGNARERSPPGLMCWIMSKKWRGNWRQSQARRRRERKGEKAKQNKQIGRAHV